MNIFYTYLRYIKETILILLKENNIETIIQDARNYDALSRTLSTINPDVIIQLAAVSHANKSNKDPHYTFDNSLRTHENTLDICRSKKTHVIFFSSSMVYGNFSSHQVNEKSVSSYLFRIVCLGYPNI